MIDLAKLVPENHQDVDPDDVTIRLFANDVLPLLGTVLSVYEEPEFSGYAPQGHDKATLVIHDGDEYVTHVFKSNEVKPVSIYGFFITDGVKVIAAERVADAPLVLGIRGDRITVHFPLVKD